MNKTIKLEKGILLSYLSKHGFNTLNSFSRRDDNTTILDVRTLNKINSGFETKIEHLEKIANEFNDNINSIVNYSEQNFIDRTLFESLILVDVIGIDIKTSGEILSFNDFISYLEMSKECFIKLEAIEFSDDDEKIF